MKDMAARRLHIGAKVFLVAYLATVAILYLVNA